MADLLANVQAGDLLIWRETFASTHRKVVKVTRVTKATFFTTHNEHTAFNKKDGKARGFSSDPWSRPAVCRRPVDGELDEMRRAAEIRSARDRIKTFAADAPDEFVLEASALIRKIQEREEATK